MSCNWDTFVPSVLCCAEGKTVCPEMQIIDYFTVVCLVAWPMNESEVRVDLAVIHCRNLTAFLM